MRRLLLIVLLATAAQSASAAGGTADGHSGLALAALVASYSTSLSGQDKAVMAQLLDGQQNFAFPAGKKIEVAADAIVCKSGDVDITARSCALTFGAKTVNITGRSANELYATLIEAGVPSDGAAGTIYEGLDKLACMIDPNSVKKQNDGGGATCAFSIDQ